MQLRLYLHRVSLSHQLIEKNSLLSDTEGYWKQVACVT